MTKRWLLLALLLLLPFAFAHNGLQHVVGTVAKVSSTSLAVKTLDGKVASVTVDAHTKWKKGSEAATAEDVKVGDRVVIHAKPVNGALQAVEVEAASAPGTHPVTHPGTQN